MSMIINIATILILCFWFVAVMMSPMGYDAPGSLNDSGIALISMVVKFLPCLLFVVLVFFDASVFKVKAYKLLPIFFIISAFISQGDLRRYLNIKKGISNEGYAVTQSAVYYNGKEIKDADPNTHVIIEEFGSKNYSKDKNHVFFRATKIEGANPKHIQMLESEKYGKSGAHNYLRDDKNVFYYEKMIPNADVESFEVINSFEAKDKNALYFQDRRKNYENP